MSRRLVVVEVHTKNAVQSLVLTHALGPRLRASTCTHTATDVHYTVNIAFSFAELFIQIYRYKGTEVCMYQSRSVRACITCLYH
jgi:hypothetical protein